MLLLLPVSSRGHHHHRSEQCRGSLFYPLPPAFANSPLPPPSLLLPRRFLSRLFCCPRRDRVRTVRAGPGRSEPSYPQEKRLVTSAVTGQVPSSLHRPPPLQRLPCLPRDVFSGGLGGGGCSKGGGSSGRRLPANQSSVFPDFLRRPSLPRLGVHQGILSTLTPMPGTGSCRQHAPENVHV